MCSTGMLGSRYQNIAVDVQQRMLGERNRKLTVDVQQVMLGASCRTLAVDVQHRSVRCVLSDTSSRCAAPLN